ncbi:MAG: SdrD B-like domain-containing protein [Patescibacteria group bacterium]
MALSSLRGVGKRRSGQKIWLRTGLSVAILALGIINLGSLSRAAEGDVLFDRSIAIATGACSVGTDFDSAGNMYVADWCDNKIHKYDPSGNILLEWGGVGSGQGQFNYPQDILVASDGRVYVTDYYNGRVQIFNTDGTYQDEFGTPGVGIGMLDDAAYITEGPDGNLYVSEATGDRLEKFDKLGNSLGEIGSSGFGDLQFNEPSGMAFGSDGNLYVTDTRNSRVQVLTPAGTFVRAFGMASSTLAPGSFSDPYDIAFDSDGRFYVVDTGNSRIQIFDSVGAFAGEFGSYGTTDGLFDYAVGVTVRSGQVYVSDSTQRVQAFDIDSETPYVRAERLDLYSSGNGSEGWNGNGLSILDQGMPTRVQLPSNVEPVKVEMGRGFTAVMADDNNVYVFGQNVSGQFGIGNTTNQSTPVLFPLPGGMTAVDVTISTLADSIFVLASDGQVYGAGSNTGGRLGAGLGAATSNVPVRFQLPGGINAASMWMNESNNLYVTTTDGDVYTAGTGTQGQLGNGLLVNQLSAVKVQLPVGVTAVGEVVSNGYSVMLRGSDGNAYSFGENSNGQLGIGTTVDAATPTTAGLPGGVTAQKVIVSRGEFNSFILGSNNQLYGAGTNFYGQLGNGNTTQQSSMVGFQLGGGLSVKTLTDEWGMMTCVIASDDNLYCAGDNTDGQLGVGDYATHSTPVKFSIPGDPVIQHVAKSEYNVFVLTDDGAIWGSGSNGYGQLGFGLSPGTIAVATEFPLPSGVTATDIMTNPDPRTRMTFMGSDKNVYSIGNDRAGKLGDGSSLTYQPHLGRYLLPKYAEAQSMHINYHIFNALQAESTHVVARTPALNAFGTILFEDDDDDGVQDPGEDGINGQTIKLYRDSNSDGIADGSVIKSAQTETFNGRQGVALFDALTEGGYVMRLTVDGTDTDRSVVLNSNEGGWFSDPSNLLIAPTTFPLSSSGSVPLEESVVPTPLSPQSGAGTVFDYRMIPAILMVLAAMSIIGFLHTRRRT